MKLKSSHKLYRWALGAFLGLFCLSILLLIFILWITLNLPKLDNLQDYKPAQVTQVQSREGKLIGEFFTERRYVLPVEEFPQQVVFAFTSAEDDRFFEHPGIDITGIMRAFLVNLKAGHVVQGGSTITQQVAKSLLLTSERSFERKFKEVLLAYKIERNLGKQQILYLYLNQIYLGQGSYGVEAAARSYFHKRAKELSIAESALLAGLVQAPSKYTPTKNPKRARERQEYVLRRMHETNHITAEQYKAALAEPIKLYQEEDINQKVAPYYVEHARQYIINKYGQDALYQGGLTVKVAADYDLSLKAMESVRANLRDLDKRQGYRGPLGHLGTQEEMVTELKKIRAELIAKKIPYLLLPTKNIDQLDEDRWHDFTLKELQASKQIGDEKELLIPGEAYRAVVTKIDPDDHGATLLIGTVRASLALKDMRWAKRIKPPELSGNASIGRVTEALHAGDIVSVRVLPDVQTKDGSVAVALEQEPIVQGALLSMEVATGHVLAMIGGYDFANSEYNRALQGERQPGSSFKALLYAAAIDKGFTPASIIVDAPIIFENQGGNNLKWIPENNSEKFYGDTTLRTALVNSRNVPAVKVLQEIQLPYFTEYLRGLGVTGAINPDLSLALGSKGMTLEEMTRLYALFPRMGMRIEPVFILKVTDHTGQTLEEYSLAEVQRQAAAKWLKLKEQLAQTGAQASTASGTGTNTSTETTTNTSATSTTVAVPEKKHAPVFDDPLRAMDEKTAYIMNYLMQEVVQYGTGTGAKVLKRKVGGKTGTTNEYIDAWFIGFSPEVVTGVWTGFDNPRTLGPVEVGGRAALPAWVSYMDAALSKYSVDEYPVPKGIVFVRIDPKTGSLASSSTSGVKEPFVEGTEPNSQRSNPQSPDSSEFFREDF